MINFVRSKNLPYSVEDVKRVVSRCLICAEVKPRFYNPPNSHLIKATQPSEHLSLDFKGPLPSSTRNKYILTIVDEYSRFPFAFPCSDLTSATVIRCLSQLFAIFGMPAYTHSDRGTSFLSSEFRRFCLSNGISLSRTTPYNPSGNGQCEKYNHIMWRAVVMALRSKHLPISCWEQVLPDTLHSIRSLLCTATNDTPHEHLFTYQRHSFTGHSVPSWLTTPGPVLLKRHIRQSKYEPLVDKVELLEANPNYAHILLPDGKTSTVSVGDLALYPVDSNIQLVNDNLKPVCNSDDPDIVKTDSAQYGQSDIAREREAMQPIVSDPVHPQPVPSDEPVLCRSTRVRREPVHLDL